MAVSLDQKQNYRKLAVKILTILVGLTCYAIGTALFVLPTDMIAAGTTGLALLAEHYWGISLSGFVAVFNVLMFLLGLIELGLQTIHDSTALRIRRGYPTRVFFSAMDRLHDLGFPVVVHTILGLPGESCQDVLKTMQALNRVRPFGVKLQLLHILSGTDMAAEYEAGKVRPLEKGEYLDLVTDCIASLSPEICIHRVTGDGPASLLIAPLWSKNKRDVLNGITVRMKEKGIRQGSYYEPSGTADSL